MSRYKLRSPSQPFAVQLALGLFEFGSSLKLAVVLIFTSALVLALATFVESKYGTPAVQFGMYGTWWFTALNALLALNIFCAAAIRYPWKRHQTGFVMTHVGLLTLLFGCLLSRRGGVDAQMPIFEGDRGHLAYEDSQSFFLTVHDLSPGDTTAGKPLDPDSLGRGKPLPPVRFVAGPFNWADYQDQLPAIPWRLAYRDRAVLYDEGGIKLEVLDYYSNSEEIDAPYVRLWMSAPRQSVMGPDGKQRLSTEQWMPVELQVKDFDDPEFRFGIGGRQQAGGGHLLLMLASGRLEVDAFLHSQPEGSQGKQGQVVLYAGGQKHRILVEEKLRQPRFPLGETGFEVEVAQYVANSTLDKNDPQGRFVLKDAGPKPALGAAVELRLFRAGEASGRLVLFADRPELNLHDHEHEVFGSYWLDHGEKSSEELVRGEGGSRIDLLQGPVESDGRAKLYYRYWNRHEVVFARELPTDETPVDGFKMPIGQLQLYVDRVVPGSRPGRVVVPKSFNKETLVVTAFRAAKVRLTVDDATEEFWLVGAPPDTGERQLRPSEKRVVASERRAVSIAMPLDAIDVGFHVALNDFEMKLDPGTSQPSHYSSYVDFRDSARDRALRSNVLITMNAPVDFSEPATGRSYRLFQESFIGPYGPLDAVFQRNVDPSSNKHQLYASVLTVNYDPGRGVKYTGCLLIVAGIATMFYMRAYFFKRPPAPADQAGPQGSKPRKQRPQPATAARRPG